MPGHDKLCPTYNGWQLWVRIMLYMLHLLQGILPHFCLLGAFNFFFPPDLPTSENETFSSDMMKCVSSWCNPSQLARHQIPHDWFPCWDQGSRLYSVLLWTRWKIEVPCLCSSTIPQYARKMPWQISVKIKWRPLFKADSKQRWHHESYQ